MDFGLAYEDIEAIVSTLKAEPKVEKVSIFGSRALGTFHSGSDIDIAVYGSKLTHDDLLNLKIALDELELLYKIDLIHFEALTNPEFLGHIKRVEIKL
ncbi:nucleotidyltransferase family protein [Owenweeksia hongkongensis]|uniref:nucleotidyltransferase family protein n=1 Tax=Owenweeksia hongkongensis TaxID=253245 RepID=UPI003A910FCD